MNTTVLQEFSLLGIDLAIGAGIGFLFDFYRVLRRFLRPGWLATQLADFFFWVCCALLTFLVFFEVNGGAVNFYNILIIPAGMACYLKWAGPTVRRPLTSVTHWLGRLLAIIFQAFCRLLRLLWLIAALPFKALWWLVHTSLLVVGALLRLLWLPVKLLWRWLWRSLREGWRRWRTKKR
jgi:spore cortex biosynthesis protein YabQ